MPLYKAGWLDVGARPSSSRGIERASANCYCVPRLLCDAPAIGFSSRKPGDVSSA